MHTKADNYIKIMLYKCLDVNAIEGKICLKLNED